MDIIQEVLAFSRDYVNGNQTTERRNKIAAAYRKATGEILRTGCSTCYIEAIFKIKKAMEKKPCSYRLKPGALLSTFSDESKTCTNANLTDELAEFHLRTNPGLIHLFSIYPSPLPWLGKPAQELEIVKVPIPEVKKEVKTEVNAFQKLKEEAKATLLKEPVKEPVKEEKKEVKHRTGKSKK